MSWGVLATRDKRCANFIVTGFVINAFACPYYAYKIDKITLGNLIDLWDKGFIYKGFPLIYYRMSYSDNSTNIAFLLRKLAPIALANFASVTCPLNSLSLPRLLIKWSSPVVQKQHFEVVFCFSGIYRGKVFSHRFLWNDEKKYVPTEEVKSIFRKLRKPKL